MEPFPKRRVWAAYALALTVLASYFKAGLKTHLLRRPLSDEDWILLHQRNAERIVKTFNRLRGIYIKIGQSFSIMGHFLPEALISPLETLQDNAPKTPTADIVSAIEASFGKPVTALFASFNPEPLATASLGQVHEATLLSGEKVAVKVRHPYIEALVKKDLTTLRRIFALFDLAFPHYGIKEVYRECAEMIRQELDFYQEGKNSERLAENLKDMPECRFPKIFWDLSSETVLTMEFMSGIKVSQVEALKKAAIDEKKVAEILLQTYCRQIFENGCYHADPHPGNILVEAGPRIIYLDFGATVSISERMRLGLARFVEGLIQKDTRVLSEALKQMGFVARGDKEEACERIVEHFYGKLSGLHIDNLANFKEIQKLETLRDFMAPGPLDFSFKELATTFHIPREWVLLERTLLLIMGSCATLDPHLNPIDIVLPYVEKFVLGKDRHLSDLVLQMLKEAGSSYLTLGVKLEQALKKLDRGELSFKIALSDPISREIRRGVQLLSSIAIAALAFFSGKSNFAGEGLRGWIFFGFSGVALYLFFKKK